MMCLPRRVISIDNIDDLTQMEIYELHMWKAVHAIGAKHRKLYTV